MPREIVCPDCGGYGHRVVQGIHRLNTPCQNPDCNKGKMTVYTQEELQERIHQACSEYADTKLYQEGFRSEVKQEREAIRQRGGV